MASTAVETGRSNVLIKLEKLLSPVHEAEFEDEYVAMRRSPHVQESGLKPTRFQFCQYLENARRGFEYTKDTYGTASLPSKLAFTNTQLNIRGTDEADWIGYTPEEDVLVVSYLHIAGQCARYDEPCAFFLDSHLEPGEAVLGQDYTLLQAIEEGHHRFLSRAGVIKNENSQRDINHPAEQAIIPVWRKAISDLGIKTYVVEE